MQLGACRFAMLAACETGLHDLGYLPDEFISLPVALNEAGVASVVASLWPVPAQPTRELVRGVFRRHIADGLAPAAALRKTQLDARGANWRFPVGEGVLGFGTPPGPAAVAHAATPNRLPMAPDLFSWAGFACFGG